MSGMDLSGDDGKKPPEKPRKTIPHKQQQTGPAKKPLVTPTGSGKQESKGTPSSSSKQTPSTSSSSGVKRKEREEDKDEESSAKKKQKVVDRGGGPQKPRLIDLEEQDTSKKAIAKFARKLSAIIYKANERDPGSLCLGPYIFRWMLFVALEQMQADKGELWFHILHWYASDQIARILRRNGQGWEEKKFYKADQTDVMLKFAECILRIAKGQASATAAADSKDASWTVSSKPMRDLARIMYERVHALVQVNTKDDTLTFRERKQGENDPYVSLRRTIGSHLHKATFDAIRSPAPPDSNAWFLWYWLDECAIPLPYRDKNKEAALGPKQELEYRGDAYILSEVLRPCFWHQPDPPADALAKGAKRNNCPMLDFLHVIEHNLHRVENGKLMNRPKDKYHPQLEGLTAAVLMLTLADPVHMLVSRNEYVTNDVNGGHFRNHLDPTNILGEVIEKDTELPRKIQSYISTCRAELKTGPRYATDAFSSPQELKDAPQTKLQVWAMHQPDAKTGVQDITNSIKDFVVAKLQGGLLRALNRELTDTGEGINRLFGLFLGARMGFRFIKNIAEPESKADPKTKKETLQLVAEKMFRPGCRFRKNRPATASLYEWAEIPALLSIDSPPSVALLFMGTSWHIRSYKDDIGSKYINDDHEKLSLVSSVGESILSREQVLTAISSGGRAGRSLTWWSNGSRRICSFVILKTRKDDDNKGGGGLVTIVVPTDIDLIARLHLLDVLREKLLPEQLEMGDDQKITEVTLTASQLEKLWNLCKLAKDGNVKVPVDFRLIDAMTKLMTNSQDRWKRDRKLLQQFSDVPTLSLPQMDTSPINDWRDSELEHVDASADIQKFNNELIADLIGINDNIWRNGMYIEDVTLKKRLLEKKIPEAIRPMYVGMLDLLAAVKCKGYVYEARGVFERTVKGRRETEPAMRFLEKKNAKYLISVDEADLVLKGIAAQKRFMEGVKERDMPSFRERIDGIIELYDDRTKDVKERMKILRKEDRAIQEAEEEEDRVNDAVTLLISRELHINAYLKTHSALYDVVADLETLVNTGKPALDRDTVTKMVEAATQAIGVVSKYLEEPITLKFDLVKQLRRADKEVNEQDPEATHYHNNLREKMPKEVTRGKTSDEVKDMAMYLMTADRLRMRLIRIEHRILRQAMELANPRYVDRDSMKDEGDGGEDDGDDDDTRVRVDEDEDGDEATVFKEDVYLTTERDVVANFNDTELIVETAYNTRLCGLTLKDVLNAFESPPQLQLQQATRELLTQEYNSLRQEDQAVDVDINVLEPLNPMEVDTEAEDQKPRLTEEGKRLLEERRRMLQATVEKKARKLERELKAEEKKGNTASSMDMTSDDDEKKKKLQSDDDRRLLKSILTRLRIVAHILLLRETLNFDVEEDIPRLEAGMEKVVKDHRAKVIFLLKEKDETFNKRANDYLKLEFIDKKYKEASERKKAATFVLGMDIETKKLDDLGLDSKSFKRSELNNAMKRQQAMAIIDPERVLMELRHGRRHPNLSLENVMHPVCKILHGNSRPRLWTLMDTAGWILQWAPNEIVTRWQQQPRDTTVAFKDGAAGRIELYQTINRIMLQQCIPFRVLRLQLILGLVPDITDLQHRGEFSSGGGDDDDEEMKGEGEEGSGGDDGSASLSMLSPNSSNDFQRSLISLENDLIARVERTKEIKKNDFMLKGSVHVDEALFSILTRDYDNEKSKSIRAAQPFLVSLCAVMYDETMAAATTTTGGDDNKEQQQPPSFDVDVVNPIDKGYDREVSHQVRAIVQQTFGSETKRNAIKDEDVENKVKELKAEQENPEYYNSVMSEENVKATRERVTKQHKRSAVLTGMLNKAVEWISADEKVQTEHSMLQQLIEVRLRDMFGTYKTQLWDVMLQDMKTKQLSKFVQPEVACLLKVALENASKEDVLLKPLTDRLDFFMSVFETNTKAFMTAVRETKIENVEHLSERVFGLNAALDGIAITTEVFLKLQESRHAWYQVAHAGIKYMQLLPYMAQLVKETLPNDTTSDDYYQWSTHESPSVYVQFAFPDADKADSLHRQILYREFQEISEILVNYGVYLPVHLDFQAVLEAYWGVDVEFRENFGEHILAFSMLYPCEPSEAKSLQSVRRLLGWQNPRDAIEYYVYKRQLQPDKPIDSAAYRDTLAPVHWELGTIGLERQFMPTATGGESKGNKDKTTYPYWRHEARALRHAARLARMHLTVLDQEVSKKNKADPNGYYVRGMKTLAEVARLFKEQKGATTQDILTRLAIPIPLEHDPNLVSTIAMLKGNEMQHLYRGVFPYDNVTKELISQGVFRSREPGKFTPLGTEVFDKTDDSVKLGLRQEQEKFDPDPARELAIQERKERKKKVGNQDVDQDWADMKQEAIDDLIDSLTLPVAATKLYFREEKGKGTKLRDDGDFARWATVDVWNRHDDQLRNPVMRALGRKVTERKKKETKKKKGDDDEDEVPALQTKKKTTTKKKKTAIDSDEEDDSRPIVTNLPESKRTGKGKMTASSSSSSSGSGKETKGDGKDTKQQMTDDSPRSRAVSMSLSTSSPKGKPTQSSAKPKATSSDDVDDLDVEDQFVSVAEIAALQQLEEGKDRSTVAKGKGQPRRQEMTDDSPRITKGKGMSSSFLKGESLDVKDRPQGQQKPAIIQINLDEDEADPDYQRALEESRKAVPGETPEQRNVRIAMDVSMHEARQRADPSYSTSNAQDIARPKKPAPKEQQSSGSSSSSSNQQQSSAAKKMDTSGRFHATPPKMSSSVLHPAAIQDAYHQRRPVRRLLKFQRPDEALERVSVSSS